MNEVSGYDRIMTNANATVLKVVLLQVMQFKAKYGIMPDFVGINSTLEPALSAELQLLELNPHRILQTSITWFYATKESIDVKPEAQFVVIRHIRTGKEVCL